MIQKTIGLPVDMLKTPNPNRRGWGRSHRDFAVLPAAEHLQQLSSLRQFRGTGTGNINSETLN